MAKYTGMEGFVKISRYAGMREDLVQAGGGNSSYKPDERIMVIKASGFQLADLTEDAGYAVVDASMIKEAFLEVWNAGLTEEKSKDILEKAHIEGGRPSIETCLHAISGKYTLHSHPITVNAITCRKDWRVILRELFPDAMLVEYATPGARLAYAYFKEYEKIKQATVPPVVFLQNHGLIVSGDTADEVIEKTELVTKKLEIYLGCDYGAYHESMSIWELMADKVVWKVTDCNILSAYDKYKGAWEHAFCPDCVVFLGKKFMKIEDEPDDETLKKFYTKYGEPVVIEYKKNLYIAADSVKKALETQSVLSFSAQVMLMNNGVECNFLSDEEQDFLLGWDAEKYRKGV